MHGKNVREKFLGGGLAGRARDARHQASKAFAPGVAQSAERLHRIVRDEHGRDVLPVEGIAFGKHGRGSGLNRGTGEVVPVRALTDDGREKVSGPGFTVVGNRAAQRYVGGVQHLGMGGPCGLLQRHQHETSSLSIS